MMGKWFAPNSVRRSGSLERGLGEKTNYFIVTFNKPNKDHLHVQTHSKTSRLATAMRYVPHSEELAVLKHLENLKFIDNNSGYDQNHGQQEKDNVDCDPTFEASYSELHLLPF